MKQIKLIFNENNETFENNINDFLAEIGDNLIDIKFMTNFGINDAERDSYFSAMIIYEE